MRRIYFLALAMLTTTACPQISSAKTALTLGGIINALSSVECYSSLAHFSVTMPQLNDDVVYDISLYQQGAPADTLFPASYLIDWTMTSREEPVKGFSAYFDGNHYRYAGERLQEYHVKWDAFPFGSGFDPKVTATGVQRTAQFANLLPASLAEELQRMQSGQNYIFAIHPDTLVNGRRYIALEARLSVKGNTAMEATYLFDKSTYMPASILYENNPGAVSEQTVSVTYTDTKITEKCDTLAEQSLMVRYPKVFENFRESNFRIENLPGTRMPGFALPTTTGERYMRRTADPFAVPTIIALLDTSHGFTSDMVSQLRQAVDALPYNADLILAFVDKHIDRIESVVPSIRPGEHLLMGAKPLARDCGAATLPAVILCDASGTVRNALIGYNNDLASDVIQKMALIPAASGHADTPEAKSETQTDNSIATSMETVYFKEQPCHTYGTLPQVGSHAPEFTLTGANLGHISSEDYKGQYVVLNIFPSLDTPVCATSVRRFNEEASNLKNTVVICVSEDLPFAMSRFCTIEGLKNVIPASAFRSPQFGEKYGVQLVDGPLAGLLTRSVIVIAPDGKVIYRELVPEITSEPDYESAIRTIRNSK